MSKPVAPSANPDPDLLLLFLNASRVLAGGAVVVGSASPEYLRSIVGIPGGSVIRMSFYDGCDLSTSRTGQIDVSTELRPFGNATHTAAAIRHVALAVSERRHQPGDHRDDVTEVALAGGADSIASVDRAMSTLGGLTGAGIADRRSRFSDIFTIFGWSLISETKFRFYVRIASSGRRIGVDVNHSEGGRSVSSVLGNLLTSAIRSGQLAIMSSSEGDEFCEVVYQGVENL